MRRLLFSAELKSNCRAVAVLALSMGIMAVPARAQTQPSDSDTRAETFAKFAGGALFGLGTHEAGHLLFDVIFDADPGIGRVDFHGIPFFAVTHRSGMPRHQEFVISSAGFWVQHVEDEWLLSRRPGLRRTHAPFAKGMLTFNVVTSIAYAGAAFAKTGPVERDTRGIADSARIDERWVGAMVLAPALLDAWRYFHPDDKWAVWASRGAKIGMVLMIVR